MRQKTLICFSLVALLALQTAQATKLYRWVDGEGNVHYTDKIPPEQVDRARHELSQQGVRKRTVERAQTQEEIEQGRKLERLRAEQQRLIAKQKAEDRVLLRTFRSEDDIALARDGKIAAVDVQIVLIKGNIRRYQKRLSEFQHRAATVERTGKAVPEPLLDSMDTTLANINESYADIERKERAKNSIREASARDLKRFRELKNLTPAKDSTREEEAAWRTLPHVVGCADEKSCDRGWSKTEAFVRNAATTPMQMIAEKIIMTAAPTDDQDVSITVARIRSKATGQTVLFMDLFCKDSPRGKELCRSDKITAIRDSFRNTVEEPATP